MSARRGIANKIKKKPRLLLVGLTGNFGTGKSTAARFFQRKGAGILSADRLAHEVFRKGNPIFPKVRALFPEGRNPLSRARIAEIVFRNPARRRALEALIHPYVFKRIREEMARRKKGIVILEVPLLFESGFDRRCDRNIVVQTPAKRALKRLSGRGFGRAEVRRRWRAQMPLGEKVRRADYVIDNSGGLRKTCRQVDGIWKELIKLK